MHRLHCNARPFSRPIAYPWAIIFNTYKVRVLFVGYIRAAFAVAVGIISLIFSLNVYAHTDALGWITASDPVNPGKCTLDIYYGSWHQGLTATSQEGQLALTGPSNPAPASFAMVPGFAYVANGTLPPGLTLGTNYFFPNIPSPPTNDFQSTNSLQGIFGFQRVQFSNLLPGVYTFGYTASSFLTAVWTPSDPAINAGKLTIVNCSTTVLGNPTVGVNKDLKNNTGQIANDIEILLQGNYSSLINRYDGPGPNGTTFNAFTLTASGGNTLLHWSNPDIAVQPGAIAHVGFTIPGTKANILGVYWTFNGVNTGCAHQVNTEPYNSTAGSTVTYKNNGLACASTPRYAGGLSVEWHANEVPLANLNATSARTPIRIDVIPDAPILLQPGAQGTVNIPQAPPNARFAVLIHKVSSNASLSGADVTTDFLQFPVDAPSTGGGTGGGGDVPTLPQWGAIMMGGLLLWTMRGANRRQRPRL